jgi:hypothetical protein
MVRRAEWYYEWGVGFNLGMVEEQGAVKVG